ncbi:AraC family transcriptional regulator [Pandoraea capi]|uniref:AraC family transcriptional regulator n=1 Tax=Pandoraea capi TaxID=2508286 RepID=A0ABY6W4Z8_9BURK|nr:AraC family transcriptional regulator [Pandoraea capi]VVE26428.1 AraC family transcriptional regulator [Pandoraea capi]
MIDPLAEVVTLLQPTLTFSKVLGAAGQWRASRTFSGEPFYCVILDGECRFTVNGRAPVTLQANDFVLVPEGFRFAMTSLDAPEGDDEADALPSKLPDGSLRFGDISGAPQVRWLAGVCAFDSPDAALLVSLLPELVSVRNEPRLATLVGLLRDESLAHRPARDVLLARLLEVIFIEALRSADTSASPGLVRGLADTRLAHAIRRMHESPAAPWTIAQLAQAASLSRSSFFERFSRAVGIAPMTYLLSWRMAIAKRLLRRNKASVATIAERVGYRSASAFSVAFTRHVGMPPSHYASRDVPAAETGIGIGTGTD